VRQFGTRNRGGIAWIMLEWKRKGSKRGKLNLAHAHQYDEKRTKGKRGGAKEIRKNSTPPGGARTIKENISAKPNRQKGRGIEKK